MTKWFFALLNTFWSCPHLWSPESAVMVTGITTRFLLGSPPLVLQPLLITLILLLKNTYTEECTHTLFAVMPNFVHSSYTGFSHVAPRSLNALPSEIPFPSLTLQCIWPFFNQSDLQLSTIIDNHRNEVYSNKVLSYKTFKRAPNFQIRQIGSI